MAAAAATTQFTLPVPGITLLQVSGVVLQLASVPSGTAPSLVVTSTFPSTISFATNTQGAGAYVLYGFTSQATQQQVTGLASATLFVPDGQLNSLDCNANAYCTVPNGQFFTSASSLTATASATLIVQEQSLGSSYVLSSTANSYLQLFTAGVGNIEATAEAGSQLFVTSAEAATSGTLGVTASRSAAVCIQGPLFSPANAAQCTLSASGNSQVALAGASFGSSGKLTTSASAASTINSCALVSSSAIITASASSTISATVNGAVSGSATAGSSVNLAGATSTSGITTSAGAVVNVGCEASPACPSIPPTVPNSYTNRFCSQQEALTSSCGGGGWSPSAACTIRVAATMLALTALLV